MATPKRIGSTMGLLAVAGLVAAVGAGPVLVSGADHLDAPTVKADGRIDITDIYAFASTGGTTLVLNVNPLLSPADTDGASFRTKTLYEFLIDTDLDASPDIAYRVKFGKAKTKHGDVIQKYKVKRATGDKADDHTWSGKTIAKGKTTAYGADARISKVKGGGWSFAGPRDDPFFFDLPGFVQFKTELLGGSTDLGVLLGGFTGSDTFAGTNVSSIVLELPNWKVGGDGTTVGIWATTSVKTKGGHKGRYEQVERMGRPAINTVFNHDDATKEAANRRSPDGDVAADLANVIGVFDAIDAVLVANALPDYDDPTIAFLASILLPDTLTFTVGDAAGFLNGRQLADDVINAEFGLLTNGNVTSDGVDANDVPFLGSFPYLGLPH